MDTSEIIGMDTSKIIGFDLEIATPIEDLENINFSDLGITCAAVYGDEMEIHYWAGMHILEDHDVYTAKMTMTEAGGLLLDLEYFAKMGYQIFTLNGIGFDFRVLFHEISPLLRSNLKCLAIDHYDIMLQFLMIYGFPVGLEAAAMGMQIGGKEAGMSGKDAPLLWPTEPERVIEYVMGDARLTWAVAKWIAEHKEVRWITKQGRPNSKPFLYFLTAGQSLEVQEAKREWIQKINGTNYLLDPRKLAGWVMEQEREY